MGFITEKRGGMKRIAWVVFGWILLSASVQADIQRFTVVGNGVIFALSEPTGWKMDTDSAKNNNLPVVYYPTGKTWSNAPTVMYVNSSINECGTSFEKFINNDIAQFKSNNPKIVIKEGEVMTVDGKKVIIKFFSDDQYGNSEAVAYLDNTDGVFITITLTSRIRSLFEDALPVFNALVASFQFIGNAVTCNSKLPSFSERVALAKRAEQQKEISSYLYNEMFPAIGSNMSELMKSCLTKTNASVDKFTIVADVRESGRFNEIDFQPRTNTASCFAIGLASFQLPNTKLCQCGSIPVVLEMTIKP